MKLKLLSLSPCFFLSLPHIYKDWKLCFLCSVELHSLTILRTNRSNSVTMSSHLLLSGVSHGKIVFYTSLVSAPKWRPFPVAVV